MATIATGATLGAINVDRRSSNHNLHTVGTAMYQLVVETVDGDPQMYKSTDYGVNWSNLDAANAPNGDNTNTLRHTIASYLFGSDIYVVYRSAELTLTVQVFATSTDTWGSSLGNATTTAASQNQPGIVVRSDGDVIVGFQLSTDDADVLYSRYESGVWTQNVVVNGVNSTSLGSVFDLLIDDTDRAYFFFIDPAASDVMYRSLNSANTLGTATDIDLSSAIYPNSATYYVGMQPYSDTDGTLKVQLAFANSTNDIDGYVISLGSDSGSGNVATEDADIHTAGPGLENGFSTFKYVSTRYIFWWDFNDQDIRYISNSGSGWGDPATNATVYQTLTGPGNIGFAGRLFGGVFIVHADNGTVSGNWFIARKPGPPFVAHQRNTARNVLTMR